MKKKEYTYLSSDNKTNIHAVMWLPDGEIKAVVQIAHGITEHILRYEELAEFLTNSNIAVVGNDHIGHGTSLDSSSVPMYFGSINSWNYVVKDIITLKQMVMNELGSISYIMLGFSLGSFLVRTILIDYPDELDNVILIGTGYISHLEAEIAKMMTNKEAKKHGEDKSTETIKKLAFETYNKYFKPNDTEFDWLCSNKEELTKYINDPLSYKTITCGLFRELLMGMNYTCNKKNIAKINKNINLLILAGDKDPVGKQGKGVKKIYQLYQKNGITNCSMKLYNDLRHDILHEINYKEIYNDILMWITTKI